MYIAEFILGKYNSFVKCVGKILCKRIHWKNMKSHSKSGSNFDVKPLIVAGEMSFICEICGRNLSDIDK